MAARIIVVIHYRKLLLKCVRPKWVPNLSKWILETQLFFRREKTRDKKSGGKPQIQRSLGTASLTFPFAERQKGVFFGAAADRFF